MRGRKVPNNSCPKIWYNMEFVHLYSCVFGGLQKHSSRQAMRSFNVITRSLPFTMAPVSKPVKFVNYYQNKEASKPFLSTWHQISKSCAIQPILKVIKTPFWGSAVCMKFQLGSRGMRGTFQRGEKCVPGKTYWNKRVAKLGFKLHRQYNRK